MSDFGDTDLLYRGPGGEQRKLIDQARRLEQYLLALVYQTTDYPTLERLFYLAHKANERYYRRHNRYYQQEA